MRQAKILYKAILAGILTETDEGEYTFAYDKEYIEKYPRPGTTATQLSLTSLVIMTICSIAPMLLAKR